MAIDKNILHLAYVSKASQSIKDVHIRDLLYVARKRNEEHGVTGFLTFGDDTFFQLIEGDETAVRNLIKNINRDVRHSSLRIVCEAKSSQRILPVWSMYYDHRDNLAKPIRDVVSTFTSGTNDRVFRDDLLDLIKVLRYLNKKDDEN